ncbi:MAG: hypothetical protein GC154_19895 [bacterium]|nr:hypothetical protein [bacterium]
MAGSEFIIELIRAYAEFFAAVAWPLVVLLIFSVVLFYFDRSVGSLFRRKRLSVNWRSYEKIINQLENHYAEGLMRIEGDHARKRLAQAQIGRARDAIRVRDEQEALRSLASLSALGVQNDSQVSNIPMAQQEGHPHADLLIPNDEVRS